MDEHLSENNDGQLLRSMILKDRGCTHQSIGNCGMRANHEGKHVNVDIMQCAS